MFSETCLATDNPLRNLLFVAWQRTTDYVPGTNLAPGTNLVRQRPEKRVGEKQRHDPAQMIHAAILQIDKAVAQLTDWSKCTSG